MKQDLASMMEKLGPPEKDDAGDEAQGYVLSAEDVKNLLKGETCQHGDEPISIDPKALEELKPAVDAFLEEAGESGDEEQQEEETEPAGGEEDEEQ